MKKRTYTLRKRAEQQEETRARIVDAAIALHEEVGPAATTISAIAERAGVERLTVYRHFPDEISLFGACSSTYIERHPLPDAAAWSGRTRPDTRTRAALATVYRYYRSTRRMWVRVAADQDKVPALAPVMDGIARELGRIRDDLLRAWKPPRARRKALAAILAHALEFGTWRSFEGIGIGDDALARLVVAWCRAAR